MKISYQYLVDTKQNTLFINILPIIFRQHTKLFLKTFGKVGR